MSKHDVTWFYKLYSVRLGLEWFVTQVVNIAGQLVQAGLR
jgi:hypothetical protein